MIDIIKLLLYVLQIVIISIWIYVWYKNYKELIRKNSIEESPYLRISTWTKNDIKIKSFSKTPIIITKIEFYKKLNNWDKYELITDLKCLTMFNNADILPNEDMRFFHGLLDRDIDWGTYICKIFFKNHIKEDLKQIQIITTPVELTIW